MDLDNVALAFSLTLFAGLATGIGGALTLFTKKTNTRMLSVSLGFAAGVMIYVSFVEILAKAQESLAAEIGETWGAWMTGAAFFGGMALIALIDKLVPSIENPHEMHRVEEMKGNDKGKRKLMRMGMLSALAIAIHNFPEGLATFAATIQDPALGVTIAVAIGIHNVPEGIAVAVPIFYATGSRLKAFSYSLLSGLAEPLGALIGFTLLLYIFSDSVLGFLFAAVAGIMVFISLDQLLPTAREYGEHHLAIYGVVGGMAVMAVSLMLLL